MRQLLLDLVPVSAPSLGDFLPGHNHQALAALAALAQGQGERFLYLWGNTGAGKTHLLRAVAAHGGRYVAAGGAALPDPSLRTPILAVDDVDRLPPAQWEGLFRLHAAAREHGTALVASGPCPPAQLELLPDLRTRLAGGLVLQLHPLADDEKLAALALHARERGFTLGGDVARYLISHWRRDMVSLYGALEALDRYSLETRRPITIPLLKAAIGQASGRPLGEAR